MEDRCGRGRGILQFLVRSALRLVLLDLSSVSQVEVEAVGDVVVVVVLLTAVVVGLTAVVALLVVVAV